MDASEGTPGAPPEHAPPAPALASPVDNMRRRARKQVRPAAIKTNPQPMEMEVPQRTAASGLRRSSNELLDALLEAIRKKQSALSGSTGKRGGRLRRQPNTRQEAAKDTPPPLAAPRPSLPAPAQPASHPPHPNPWPRASDA